MKILIAPAKAEMNKCDEAEALVKSKMKDEAEVVRADAIDWEQWKAETGSWNGAYALAAKKYDRLVLTETADGGIGKGQHSLWMFFAAAQKRVGIIRHNSVKIDRVDYVSLNTNGDWKTCYATVAK